MWLTASECMIVMYYTIIAVANIENVRNKTIKCHTDAHQLF